jgi:hypothetical protein
MRARDACAWRGRLVRTRLLIAIGEWRNDRTCVRWRVGLVTFNAFESERSTSNVHIDALDSNVRRRRCDRSRRTTTGSTFDGFDMDASDIGAYRRGRVST